MAKVVNLEKVVNLVKMVKLVRMVKVVNLVKVVKLVKIGEDSGSLDKTWLIPPLKCKQTTRNQDLSR